MRSAVAVNSNDPPGRPRKVRLPFNSPKLSMIVGAMRRFFRDEPADDPLEARPPERPGAGARQHGAEVAAPDRDQLGYRIGRQLARKATDEFGQGLVDADAEIRSARIGVEFVEGLSDRRIWRA